MGLGVRGQAGEVFDWAAADDDNRMQQTTYDEMVAIRAYRRFRAARDRPKLRARRHLNKPVLWADDEGTDAANNAGELTAEAAGRVPVSARRVGVATGDPVGRNPPRCTGR
jgi:hypothetical protein